MEGKEDKLSGRLARFWRTLFLTEDGRPKSTLLLYSFALSFVYLGIYIAVYALLSGPLDKLFDGAEVHWVIVLLGVPVTWKTIVESVILGLLGSVVCCALSLLAKNRLIPAGAYIWLVVLLLVVLVAAIFVMGEYYWSFVGFLLLYVPAGLLSGTIFTHHRYGVCRRAALRKKMERAEAGGTEEPDRKRT